MFVGVSQLLISTVKGSQLLSFMLECYTLTILTFVVGSLYTFVSGMDTGSI